MARTVLKYLNILPMCIASLFIMKSAQAQPNYIAVSNCFWVVAPIHELSMDMQLNELWSFTQGRVGWLGGFIQANKGNKDFDAAFSIDLEIKKTAGLAMKDELREAITRRDASKYQQIISKVVKCDQIMGIRTGSIPRMGM